MSHASKLLLLSCLACAFACTVPTIDELEAKRPVSCNSDHKCPSEAVCFENRCIRTADLGCIPGTRVACGTDEGICVEGSRLCGAQGTYGACEGEVGPAVEVCDGQDNDCDGTFDRWAPIKLPTRSDSGSSVAAIAVAPVGQPPTLLVVTAESGSLLIRARSADGELRSQETLTPPSKEGSFESPAVVADKDTVVLGWIERTVVAGRPPSFKVYLALLDGSGKRTAVSPLQVPYSSSLPDVRGLTLAINRVAILVLVKTEGPPPTTGTGTLQQLSSVTVPRDLQPRGALLPQPAANPRDNFGPHATASGSGDQFLVACDDAGTRKVMAISNSGSLGATVNLNSLDENTHSPFLSPAENSSTNFSLYYVQNKLIADVRTAELSLLSYTAPTAPTAPPVLTTTRLTTHPEHIERMRMAVRPGERKPHLSLWVTQDPNSGRRSLVIAAHSAIGVEDARPREVMPDPHFGEELVLMPEGFRYVLYHHIPTVLAPAAGLPSDVYIQPFCGL